MASAAPMAAWGAAAASYLRGVSSEASGGISAIPVCSLSHLAARSSALAASDGCSVEASCVRGAFAASAPSAAPMRNHTNAAKTSPRTSQWSLASASAPGPCWCSAARSKREAAASVEGVTPAPSRRNLPRATSARASPFRTHQLRICAAQRSLRPSESRPSPPRPTS